jgi:hypothetical protein
MVLAKMKREYLENYEAHEREEFGRYERKLLSQGHDSDEKYILPSPFWGSS